eukprot:g60580.t1
MFTWLAQSSTMQSLRFALAYITFQPPKSRNWKPIVYISKTRKHTGKYDVGWNRSYAPQDYIAFTFEDIINIVSLDFAHSHFTLGDAVFVRKDGRSTPHATKAILYQTHIWHTPNRLSPLTNTCKLGQ